MKKIRLKLSFVLTMLILAGFGCNNSKIEYGIPNNNIGEGLESGIQSRGVMNNEVMITTRFVEEDEFRDTLHVKAKEIEGYPILGIVNHHALAMDLQARFFKSLKEVRPDIKRFIVISPDHFLAGDRVSTHGFTYVTPAGRVESAPFEVGGVYESNNVDDFVNEHGVGALAPFVVREFPDAEIVPIYIRPEATREQLYAVGNSMAEIVDVNAFVILSSDMSHYLSDEEARENDKMTLSWIEGDDWANLETASDDYTDSKHGFVVLEAFFDTLKQDTMFKLLDYAVSTDYGANSNETTSYINGFYIIKE